MSHLPVSTALLERIETILPSYPEADCLHYTDGQILFYKDHMPFGVFILKSGNVLCVASANTNRSTCACRNNHSLGLLHFLNQTPYCCTCSAVGKANVLFFPKRVINALLDKISLTITPQSPL